MSEAFPITPDSRYRLSTASSNQAAFTVPFPFLGASELTVYKFALNGAMSQLSRPANFSVTGAGNPLGGTVTLKTGAKAGEKLLIVGSAARGRSSDVTRGGKFSSAAIDEDLDRLTLIAQEQDREIGRAVKMAYGVTPPTVSPGAAGTVPKWDASGNLVEGPDSAALEHIDTALAVEAGRALVYPAAPAAEVYDAGGRPIRNLADGADSTDAATKGQLDALTEAFGLDGIDARFDALETSVGQGWVTGDLKLSLSDDDQDGWLPLDARTIGDESSGATARADADTHDLFVLIWTKYDNALAAIQSSAGAPASRGATAEADWLAHRRLPLLAAGGEFLRFLDRGRGVDADRVLGSAQAEMIGPHTHTATFTGEAVGNHTHAVPIAGNDSAGSVAADATSWGGATATTQPAGGHTPAGTVTVAANSGTENRVRNIAFPLFVKL